MVQNFHSSWRFYPKRKVPSPNPIEMELGALILCNIRPEDYLRIRYDFFFMCVCLFWPNPLCLIFHHGRLLFTTPGLFKPLTFSLFLSILVTFWVNFRKVWTLGQSNDVSTMGVTLYYFPLRYCLITKSLKNTLNEVIFSVLLKTLSSILLQFL